MALTTRRVTPKTLILDLLRVAPEHTAPVRGLVAIGELFGFTDNAVRVSVTRLVTAGLLESDERGSYRLSRVADPVAQHVEGWREGEARRRSWRGGWLAAWLPARAPRRIRGASRRALDLLGFVEALPGLMARPDNLAGSTGAIRERLDGLGLEGDARVFEVGRFDDALESRLRDEAYPTAAIAKSWASMRAELTRSEKRLPRLPVENAVVESFLRGGAAIRILATDPLLPDEILPGDGRAELTAAMKRYDRRGRRLWGGFAEGLEMRTSPADLTATIGVGGNP